MFDRLKDLFSGVAEVGSEDRERHIHLASAILLYEVVKADHEVDVEEEAQLQKVLREHWQLSDTDLADLISAAARQADVSVSLHDQLEVINEHFSQPEKFRLLKGMWSIALADEKIHQYEEQLIRRVAEMLHVSHSHFIKAKCEVMDAQV